MPDSAGGMWWVSVVVTIDIDFDVDSIEASVDVDGC